MVIEKKSIEMVHIHVQHIKEQKKATKSRLEQGPMDHSQEIPDIHGWR